MRLTNKKNWREDKEKRIKVWCGRALFPCTKTYQAIKKYGTCTEEAHSHRHSDWCAQYVNWIWWCDYSAHAPIVY